MSDYFIQYSRTRAFIGIIVLAVIFIIMIGIVISRFNDSNKYSGKTEGVITEMLGDKVKVDYIVFEKQYSSYFTMKNGYLNMNVIVYYNPFDPNESKLSIMSKTGLTNMIIFICLLFLIVLGFVYLIYRYKPLAEFFGFKQVLLS